jgi:hypothetical protein
MFCFCGFIFISGYELFRSVHQCSDDWSLVFQVMIGVDIQVLVCVCGLLTCVLSSSFTCTQVSKSGSWPSHSGPMVNLMFGSILLRCTVNPSTWFFCICTNVSSTYLYQTGGMLGTVSMACLCNKNNAA